MAGSRRGGKFTPAANGGGWCRPDKRLAIYLRDDFLCVYCGASPEDGAVLQLDHYVRVQDGGTNDPSNLVTACAYCNNSKNNDTIRQWYRRLRENPPPTFEGPVDTSRLGRRIRRQMSKDLGPFREIAKLKLTSG